MRPLALLAALVLTWSVHGYASGRAACRVVYGPPLWAVCYTEAVVWSAGPLEVALGLEWRPPDTPTPYTLVGVYTESAWATFEIARSLHSWRWALGAGIRW